MLSRAMGIQRAGRTGTVWRCHVPESYARSYHGRMWAFFVFVLSAATAVLRTERPDIIVATSPPLIVVVPALLAARLRRAAIPWIFEVRDLWPKPPLRLGFCPENLL